MAGLQLICGDGVEIARQQRGLRPHPRSRQRRLRAGMSAADDQDVEFIGIHVGSWPLVAVRASNALRFQK